MRLAHVLLAVGLATVLVSCSSVPETTTPGPSSERTSAPDEAALREAAVHTREGRFTEALSIYQRELRKFPDNTRVLAGYANMLHEQGRREADPKKQRRLLLEARKMAEKAEQLGTDHPLTPLILGSITPDGTVVEGTKGNFSSDEKVDDLMHRGEAAFGRRDMDAALRFYREAHELQPTNYMATLYIGDVYFSRNQYAEARDWFGRAVALDPDREVGHRYLGDALMQLGNRQGAMREWIEAVICEPYARLTRQHFGEKTRAAAEKAGFVVPRFPAVHSEIKDGQVQLSVDPEEGMLIMAYSVSAIGWRMEEFAKRYPGEAQLRRSLPEEVAAIDAMLEIAENGKSDPELAPDLERWGSVIRGLRSLKEKGLLEAFILLDRADAGIAMDYAPYREQHPELLRRYIRHYWCGLADDSVQQASRP